MERKTELAQQAADAMEIDSEKQTLQETVQKAVEAALQQQNKPAGKTKSRSNKVLPPQKYEPTAANSSLGKRKEPDRDEACLYPEQTLRHKESQGHQKLQKAETPIERPRIGAIPEEREERQGQGKEDFVRSARWSVNNPSSIPRENLNLAPETALSIIQSRISLTQVSNADARIKLGPGVTSIPGKIDDFLSLGHRFLSPSVFNVFLPLEVFSSLSTRIKWKVFFAHKQAPSDFLEWNPQYRILKPETIALPASTAKWVEDMLDRGRTELSSQLRAIPDSATKAVITPNYKSDLKCLENGRNMNNILVLQSDKNLKT